MKRVLALPAYRRLLLAYMLNQLAWAMATVLLAYLVYRRTGSAVGAMGFFLCAQFGPALIAPALVARLDQRSVGRVLPVLYALEGAAYLVLAVIASNFSLAPLLVVVLLDGVLAQAARALARAATVEVTAPAGLLREGNALNNVAFSICYFTGPTIGGLVVVAGGASAALVVIGGLFALMALTLATAGGLPGAVREPAPFAGRLGAALRHARERPAIERLLGLQAVALVFFTISVPVEVVLVKHSLHGGQVAYGALLSTWGGGAVAGSAVYTWLRRMPTRLLIALGSGALAVGFGVMAGAPTLAVAMAGAVLAGAGNGIEAVAMRTGLQEQTDQRWMALIMSLNESIFQAMPGAGILLGGLITALTGPRAALVVAASGALAITGLVWIVLRPGVFTESESPSPPVDVRSAPASPESLA